MDFSRMSDGIRLHHASHSHDGSGYDDGPDPAWRDSNVMTDAGDHGGPPAHAPDLLAGRPHAHLADSFLPIRGSGSVQSDQSATHGIGAGSHVVNNDAASSDPAAIAPVSSALHVEAGPAAMATGGITAGNGGDGSFYGGVIHASLLIYEPINISVALGYGSVALAGQSNGLILDQSAFQMAGVGGSGGNDNLAAGGNVGAFSTADVIATGGNGAGNGGNGHFSGALVDAPVVIYHPTNIAVAGSGGTAHAMQSNSVEIDQSATQIAGVGGNGGNGNVAAGGSILTLDPSWGSTGGSQAGNGGDGSFHGGLVHTSFALYDPVNIAVAGYNSNAYAIQTSNVQVDQSTIQIAGMGAHGGNGNAAAGGIASLLSHGLWGGSDAIATGESGAGNGGNGYFIGSLIDISVAIYAPINIAIAGPQSTAVADQTNNVHIDQSAVQIAGIGGDGGHDNLALGGGLAAHLLSDLHLAG